MSQNNNQNHVITIDQEVVELMNTQIKKAPKLLQKSAAKSSCCIFRVPQSLVKNNKEKYHPQIISIGPYHYGKKDLKMIQEHKGRFLDDMLTRTDKQLGSLMNIIVSRENDIRESYSESIDRFSTNDLAKMMVLDGVFLIELFRIVGKLVTAHVDDPIFKMGWISPFLMRDLLKIENQIPFFVLQDLFEASKPNTTDTHTLQSLILVFFSHMVDRKEEVLPRCRNLDGKHLLDFFRKSFVSTNNPTTNNLSPKPISPKPISHKPISPASELITAGVKFKVNHEAYSFLDIEFHNGLLLIPVLKMDDFYSSFLMNSVAFEQCYFHCSKDITTYVAFMSCLMNNSIDVNLILRKKVIENYFGADQEIAKFFHDIGKDVAFDSKNHYLLALFVKVNAYCENGWQVGWAEFKHTYFESPWVSISAFAAFILLSLAVLQTLYTIEGYYK